MATPLQDDESQPTTGQVGSGVTTTPGASSSSSAVGGSTAPASSASTPNTQADTERISNLNQNADFSGLTGFVQNQAGGTAKNAITNAANQFTNTLGGWNQFGAADQDTIDKAISGAGDFFAAHDLLNKSYSGPSAIDRSQYDPQVQNYQQQSQMLGNQSGFNAVEGMYAPSTTQGGRNFDWAIFGGNPNYKAATQGVQNDANLTAQSGDQAAQTALGQVNQRKNDISAFNTAAKGYVQSQMDNLSNLLNQQASAANAQDAANAAQYAQFTGQGPQTFSTSGEGVLPAGYYLPGASHYDPGTGNRDWVYSVDAPSNTAPYSYSQTVTPGDYANYTAAKGTATAANIASAAQRGQYNTMQELLDQYNYMDYATPYTASSLNINQSALSQALANAQAQVEAAKSGNSQWAQQMIASGQAKPWNQIMAPIYQGMYGDAGISLLTSNPSMGLQDPNTGNWYVPGVTPGYPAQTQASPSSPGYIGPDGSWIPGMARGGVVKPRAGGIKPGPVANPLNSMGKSGDMPQIASAPNMPSSGLQDNSSILNPVGQVGYAHGGPVQPPPGNANPLMQMGAVVPPAGRPTPRPNYAAGGNIPLNAGIPGQVDSVPIQANAGEYVVRKPSAQAVGQRNLDRLNDIANQPPAKQALMRNALHQALNRAAVRA